MRGGRDGADIEAFLEMMAIERGAAAKVLPLDRLPAEIIRFGHAPVPRLPA